MQETTTAFDGSTVYRWWAKLDSGKSVVTWNATEAGAVEKIETKRQCKVVAIRPSGNLLIDSKGF